MSNHPDLAESDLEPLTDIEPDTHDNAAYRPSASPPPLSEVHTTPSRREGDKQTPDQTKKRVDLAVQKLSQDRCLIEEMTIGSTVEYAHVLARRTPLSILDRLEYSWGMKRYTLNIHSRYNVFRLGVKYHTLFDEDTFLLLPSLHVVNKYHDAIMPVLAPDGSRKDNRKAGPPMTTEEGVPFDYTLLAHPAMIDVPIIRRRGPITVSPPPPSDYAISVYPYLELGPLKSHITPRYMICNAGMKLTGKQTAGYFKTIENFVRGGANPITREMLIKIVEIYTEWTKPVPDGDGFLLSGAEDDDVSDTTEKTAPKRAWPRRGKRVRSVRRSGNDSPTPSSKKPKADGGNNDAVWLDDETLHELDHNHSLSPEDTKLSLIQHWIDDVVKNVGPEVADEGSIDRLAEEKDVVGVGIVATREVTEFA